MRVDGITIYLSWLRNVNVMQTLSKNLSTSRTTNPPTTNIPFTCTATVTRLQTHRPVNFAHIALACTFSGGISTDIVADNALHILLQNNIILYQIILNRHKYNIYCWKIGFVLCYVFLVREFASLVFTRFLEKTSTFDLAS